MLHRSIVRGNPALRGRLLVPLAIIALLAALFASETIQRARADTVYSPACVSGIGDMAALATAASDPGTATINLGTGCIYRFDSTTPGPLTITGDITIDGNGATITGGAAHAFVVNSGATLSLDDLALSANSSSGDGGAIYSQGGTVTVTGSSFSGNSAGSAGGAIANDGGSLTVTGSTFSGNTGRLGGGAILGENGGTITVTASTFSGNQAPQTGGGTGGAIDNITGSATIVSSTFAGNSAEFEAGAIYNGGTMTVTNSTFTGNSVTDADGEGGAIYNGAGALTVTNSTLSGNSTNKGGGIYDNGYFGATATVNNTILTGNTGGNCFNFSSGTWTGSHNLSSDSSCAGAGFPSGFTIAGTNADLGPLADNGGPTLTMLPLTGSDAIDTGDDTVCAETGAGKVNDVDQRGDARPYSAHCDIGAVEVQSTPYFAGDLVVTTGADVVAADNACSLREAIDTMQDSPDNNDCGPSPSSATTITFSPSVPEVILNGSSLPLISGTVTIDGGATGVTIDAGGNSRIFDVHADGTLTLDHLTLTRGHADSAGAIEIETGGGVIITDSTVSANTSDSDGGAIVNHGTLTIYGSTFENDKAAADRYGGAIISDGDLFITNSTFYDNTAGAGGGALINTSDGSATIMNSTFSNNTAATAGGIYNAQGTVIINNSLAAANTGGDCGGAAGWTGSHNLDDDGTCAAITGAGFTESSNIDLGPLQDNGGPTYTMAPGSGSDAIGAGDAAVCFNAPVNNLDQRGVARHATATDGACDIGAVEAEIAQPDLVIAKSGPATALPGTSITYTITVTNQGAATATTPTVTDTLPDGLTFDQAATDTANSGGVTCGATGQAVTCNMPDVSSTAGSNAVTFSIVVSAPNSLAKGVQLSNTASVATTDTESDTTNNTSTPAVVTTIQGASCTTVCYVSTTGSNANSGATPGEPLRTIQFAEDSVDSGGTIIVAAGTYNESVIINKGMTLKGYKAGWDARYRTPSFGGETIVDSQGVGAFGDGFAVYTTDPVTIDGFTFQGNNSGIFFDGGTAGTPASGDTAINNIFKGNGNGIYADHALTGFTASQNLFDSNNLIHQGWSWPGVGILLHDSSSDDVAKTSTTIEDNAFVGNQLAAIFVDRGLYVVGLDISDNTSSRDGAFAMVENAGTVSITGNTVSNTTAYPALGGTGSAVQLEGANTVTISGNTITSAAGAGLAVGVGGLQSNGVTITGNTFSMGGYGIQVLAGGLASGSEGSALTVTKNTFKSSKTAAIEVESDVDTSGLAINDNSIAGNAAGLTNASGQFDATCNWWGSNSGPRATGITNGYGDSVSGLDLASFAPWLTSSNLSFPCDQSAPTVTIVAPTNGATYKLRQNVRPVFNCSDSGGSGIASCTVTAGGSNYSVDTSSSGPHTFTVTATDKAGNVTIQSVTYTVG